MSTPAQVLQSKQGATGSRAAASRVQARLKVGRSNDTHEQEADRVAESVVGNDSGIAGPASQGTGKPVVGAASVQRAPNISRLAESSIQNKLQRRETEEKEEQKAEKVQRQEEEEEEVQPKLQRQEEEEEAQPKLQRQEEEEEAQPKLQRQEEEEEAQPKLQRQEEEEE
ncbi:MAG: hypothetical protein GY744_15910, partial [Gammaproteobacteria bacterium]|nr:hypothetical protein [Gammaproteobacteria bacterium]